MLPRSYRADTRVMKAVDDSRVVGPDAEFLHDQDFGRQIHLHPAVQFVLGAGLPEVLHQVVGTDGVGVWPSPIVLRAGLSQQQLASAMKARWASSRSSHS